MKKFVLIAFVLACNLQASTISDKKALVKSIDNNIKKEHKNILIINKKTNETQNKVKLIEEDIKRIEGEHSVAIEELSSSQKKIDYLKKNIKIMESELLRSHTEFNLKIRAWNRHPNKNILATNPIIKRNYKIFLLANLHEMKNIREKNQDATILKGELNHETTKKDEINRRLHNIEKNLVRKKESLKEYMGKLSQNKRESIAKISQLERQKRRIEREIQNIIKNRTHIDTKIVDSKQAYGKLGKLSRPLNGKIILPFHGVKAGVISNGIEIAGNLGDEIVSSANGRVIYADKFSGLGTVVMIDFGYNTIGVYGNLIASKVRLNQKVRRGEKIGILGKSVSGESNLYYEIRFNLKPINPVGMF